MEEDIAKDSVSEQNNVENDSNHYIEAIKEMKANTVDKEAYLKLKEENNQEKGFKQLRLCRKCAKTKKCFNGIRTN